MQEKQKITKCIEDTIIELPKGRQAVAKGIWKQITDREATWKPIESPCNNQGQYRYGNHETEMQRPKKPSYADKLLMKIALRQMKSTQFDKMVPSIFEVKNDWDYEIEPK